jgi:hypothetical protein
MPPARLSRDAAIDETNALHAHYLRGNGMGPTEDNHMDADIRSRVVTSEHNIAAILQRTSALEAWQRQMEIFNARRDEQFTQVITSMKDLRDKIDGAMSKVLWLVVSSVIVVIVGFALKGGFIVP